MHEDGEHHRPVAEQLGNRVSGGDIGKCFRVAHVVSVTGKDPCQQAGNHLRAQRVGANRQFDGSGTARRSSCRGKDKI